MKLLCLLTTIAVVSALVFFVGIVVASTGFVVVTPAVKFVIVLSGAFFIIDVALIVVKN